MRPEDKQKLRQIMVRVMALLLAMLFVLPVLPLPEAKAASDGMVRVKLTRLGSHSSITLQTTCDYYVASQPSLRIKAGKTATVKAEGSSISVTVDGKTVSAGSELKLMRSTPGKTGLKFTSPKMSNLYCGDLFLTASSSILTPILNIYMEDYLYGVVGYEMSPSNHIEALKVQAVAARNYALRKMNDRKSKDYHVVDTTSNQVFKGYNSAPSYANVVKAVDATKGVVLYSGSSLAQCYYGSSNGGQTESTKNAWGTALKYSVVKDDPYDLESTGTTRTATIAKNAQGLNANLESALAKGIAQQLVKSGMNVDAEGIRIDGITAVQAKNPRFASPSRLYGTLTFTVRATACDLSGNVKSGTAKVDIDTYGALENWYSLSINSGNNETVWVEETDSAFVIAFRRNGHGVGMSQRGAQVMAKKHGKTAQEILAFYYPGTEPKQISLQDTTADKKAEPEYKVMATARARENAVLYDSASTSAKRVASLQEDATVEVYAVSGSWVAAGCGGKVGFMPVSMLSGYIPAGERVTNVHTEQYATVTVDGTPLLELPAADSTQRGKLAKGTAVRVYAYTENWVSVMLQSGETGFAAKAALALVDAVPTPAPEDPVVIPEEELYAKVSNASGTALRKSALGDAAVTAALTEGEYVLVTAYNTQWAYVTTRTGTKGFVLRADLKQVDAAEALATPSPSPTPEIGVTVPEEDMYARATAAAVVYKSASAKASQVTKLAKGEAVQVLAYTDAWVQVLTATGYRGFVEIARLKQIPAAEALATPVPTEDPGNVVTVKGKQYVYISGASAKMYKSYSEDSGVLKTLPYGTKLLLGAYNDEWGYVRSGSLKGFVRLSSLTKKSPTAKSANDVIYAEFNAQTKQKAPVYKSASSSARVIGSLKSGQRVKVHAYNNAYAYISVGSNYGFVAIKYLKIVV